jgi:hypothetical protein
MKTPRTKKKFKGFFFIEVPMAGVLIRLESGDVGQNYARFESL